MRKLAKKDYELLNKLMGMTEDNLHIYMKQYLEKRYENIIDDTQYILAEGNIPVALLAHLDTVDPSNSKYMMVYDQDKNILASLFGLGFDDRAGVAAIIKVLGSGLRPTIILCHGEEKGCIGSGKLVRDYPQYPFTEKLKYMIQIDRRGTNDCVFYDDDNKEFVKYVESFGYYKEAMGSFTDIATICPKWGFSAVNLSTGYFNEHTTNEYLLVPAWYETIAQVKLMLNKISSAPYFTYVPSLYAYNYGYGYGHNGQYLSSWYDDYSEKCDGCGKEFKYEDLIDVTLKDGTPGYYCPECLAHKATWCQDCQDFFEIDPQEPDEELCYHCRKDAYYKYDRIPKYSGRY